MGCLSACKFSNWSTHTEDMTTGKKPDPRSYCIQKTLQEIVLGGDVNNHLMFAGHNAFEFSKDPFYNDGFRVGPISWDGKSSNGENLSAGLYIANLNINLENGKFETKSIRIAITP